MPYDNWSGFAYCELGWSSKDFWSATVWDIISAMIFHNKKHTKEKPKVSKKHIEDLHERMKIQGRI